MSLRKLTTGIVIHGSWTRPGMDIGADDIRVWHLERGFSDIGYHYVIRRDGTVEEGRDLDMPGAHTRGHNATTIGVCLVGGRPDTGSPLADSEEPYAWDFNYTMDQISQLIFLIEELREEFPSIAYLKGHRDFTGVVKQCPGFDVGELLG